MKISETHRYDRRDDNNSVISRVYLRIPYRSSKPLEIFRLRTNKTSRRKGLASSLINEVVEKFGCDRDLKLRVSPEKGSGLTKKDLYDFYSRFGFVRHGDTQTMVRVSGKK